MPAARRTIATDQQIAARHLAVEVDRDTASRLGVSLSAIDQTLYDTFGERQVATIYSSTTQYKVLLEAAADFERDPAALSRLYVLGRQRRAGAAQHRRALRRHGRAAHHQPSGPFPAVTLSFNLAPGAALSEAVEQIDQAARRAQRADHRAWRLPGHGADLPGLARQSTPYADRWRRSWPSTSCWACSTRATSIPSPSSRPCPRPASARCWR